MASSWDEFGIYPIQEKGQPLSQDGVSKLFTASNTLWLEGVKILPIGNFPVLHVIFYDILVALCASKCSFIAKICHIEND